MMSFVLADLAHEFLVKGFAEQMMDMLGPTSLTKDAGDFFQTSDFTDVLRKLPFLVTLQQAFQHLYTENHLTTNLCRMCSEMPVFFTCLTSETVCGMRKKENTIILKETNEQFYFIFKTGSQRH